MNKVKKGVMRYNKESSDGIYLIRKQWTTDSISRFSFTLTVSVSIHIPNPVGGRLIERGVSVTTKSVTTWSFFFEKGKIVMAIAISVRSFCFDFAKGNGVEMLHPAQAG